MFHIKKRSSRLNMQGKNWMNLKEVLSKTKAKCTNGLFSMYDHTDTKLKTRNGYWDILH